MRKMAAQDRIAAKKLKKQQNIRTTLDTANTGGPRNQVRKVGSTTLFLELMSLMQNLQGLKIYYKHKKCVV